MVAWIIIPLGLVAAAGIGGYILYRYVLFDLFCKQSVNKKLDELKIDKTPYQIIKEYHKLKGENLTEKEISHLEKQYRQTEPEQFLSMYDKIREKTRNDN